MEVNTFFKTAEWINYALPQLIMGQMQKGTENAKTQSHSTVLLIHGYYEKFLQGRPNFFFLNTIQMVRQNIVRCTYVMLCSLNTIRFWE
jgi:hypothetical protein